MLIGAILVIAVLLLSPTAFATHLPYDSIYKTGNANWNCFSGGPAPDLSDRYCQTDNISYDYWLAGGSSSEQGQIRAVLNNEYNDTDLNPVEVSSPVWNASGTGETDLIIDEVEMDNFFPGFGLLGIAWCDNHIDTVRCDQHYAFVDDDVTPNYGGTGFTMNACHEIGHTVGLTHPVDAAPSQSNGDDRFKCMNQGIWSYTGPGDNNKHQINTVY